MFVLFALVLARKFGVMVATVFSTLGAMIIYALSGLFLAIPASPFLFALFLGLFAAGQAASGKGILGLFSNSGDAID